MGFCCSAGAARSQVLRLLTAAVVSVMLFGVEGASSGGARLNGHQGTSNLDFHLPSGIPTQLTNFTHGRGNFSAFLMDVFVGVGRQEYTYNGTTWVNTNVSAALFNSGAEQVAHHFFLPQPGVGGGVATWATSNPASQVTAAPAVKIPQKTAVPFLLLDATFNEGASGVQTTFGNVTHVQRLRTFEGLPPTVNGTIGQTFESSYTAIYAFYQVPK